MNATTEQLAELGTFETPTIATALSRLDVRPPTTGFASGELRCLFPQVPPIVGFAVTCIEDTTTPVRNVPTGEDKLFESIAQAVQPSIVVTKDAGLDRMRSCHLGDGMAAAMQRMGGVGFITDGTIRDVPGIRENAEGFQVFAAGSVPAAGQPNLIDFGTTVSIFGLQISAGDLLHGDSNGVVSIPVDAVADVIVESHNIVAREQARMEYLKGPEFTLEGWLERLR